MSTLLLFFVDGRLDGAVGQIDKHIITVLVLPNSPVLPGSSFTIVREIKPPKGDQLLLFFRRKVVLFLEVKSL